MGHMYESGSPRLCARSHSVDVTLCPPPPLFLAVGPGGLFILLKAIQICRWLSSGGDSGGTPKFTG